MALLLEFHAGNADTIGADFTAENTALLRDGTHAIGFADFSLGISPTDLDLHSEDVIDVAWVKMVASTDAKDAAVIAAAWIDAVGEELEEETEVTPDTVEAVGALIRLCALAVRDGVDVVHVWRL
jgi:tRNA A-37 threonylcarbamoyl transferase component Bud32